jgi:hypothetical protein
MEAIIEIADAVFCTPTVAESKLMRCLREKQLSNFVDEASMMHDAELLMVWRGGIPLFRPETSNRLVRMFTLLA